MSKIICDVCGTSYAETATQCPICGCVRSAEMNPVSGAVDLSAERNSGSYAYVKGGRFSRSNVRRRNTPATGEAVDVAPSMEDIPMEKGRNDKGLVIAVVLLLLAIIAVVIYITLRFFGPAPESEKDNAGNKPQSSVGDSQEDDDQQGDDLPEEVLCDSLLVSDVTVTFDEAGKTLQLTVTPEPADTTEAITFVSDNADVATVDENGLITAVATGETIIRIQCGSAEAQCSVTCAFSMDEGSDENPDQDSDKDEQPSNVTLELTRTDFTLFVIGEKFNLHKGDIPAEEIQWSTSDADVATVENGVVTMVGNSFQGDCATITAEYQGAKVTCIVRWGGKPSGVAGNGNVSEAG